MANTKTTPRKRTTTGMKIQCSKCDKKLANMTTLKRHCQRFHEETIFLYSCDLCTASCTRVFNIKRHIRAKHHGEDENNYTKTSGSPKEVATKVKKWVPPFEARKYKFRTIPGTPSVTYPEPPRNNKNILGEYLYLSDSTCSTNSEDHTISNNIDWETYTTDNYGYLTEKPRSTHHYRQLGTIHIERLLLPKDRNQKYT